jgi:hypothetical protein
METMLVRTEAMPGTELEPDARARGRNTPARPRLSIAMPTKHRPELLERALG